MDVFRLPETCLLSGMQIDWRRWRVGRRYYDPRWWHNFQRNSQIGVVRHVMKKKNNISHPDTSIIKDPLYLFSSQRSGSIFRSIPLVSPLSTTAAFSNLCGFRRVEHIKTTSLLKSKQAEEIIPKRQLWAPTLFLWSFWLHLGNSQNLFFTLLFSCFGVR